MKIYEGKKPDENDEIIFVKSVSENSYCSLLIEFHGAADLGEFCRKYIKKYEEK